MIYSFIILFYLSVTYSNFKTKLHGVYTFTVETIFYSCAWEEAEMLLDI